MSIAMSAPPTANTHPRPLSGRFEMPTAPTTENAMDITTEMETNISDVSVSSSTPTGMAGGGFVAAITTDGTESTAASPGSAQPAIRATRGLTALPLLGGAL